MIVSHSNKFIYVKSYKTASTSVEIFFERFCNNLDIVGYRGPNPVPKDRTWYNHMTPSQIKKQLNDNKVWDNYIKFGCIRNPWDRIVSSYFFDKYWAKNMTTEKLDNWKQKQITKSNYYKKIIKEGYKPEETFEEYCMNKKFSSLRCFYDLDMDYYIRFETLHESVRDVCHALNLECDLSHLPHKKKTDHKHYTEYYTDEMRDKIAEDCRDDIDFFNYTFGG